MPEPLKPRVCGTVGCYALATHLAGIWLRPHRRHGNGQMPLLYDLPLCTDHAATLSLKGLVTDEAWARILRMMEAVGRSKPDRGRTAVFTMEIDKAPPQFRDRYEGAPPHA